MHWSDLFHSGASLFIVATASTKTMVPLRILAIATNCILITYFAVMHSWLPLALQAAALPLNGWRLYQMVVLIGNVREAISGKPSLDWLKPFMSDPTSARAICCSPKAKTAAEMFYIMTGRYVLAELGVEIAPGHLAGELAMLAPDNRRILLRSNASKRATCCRSPTSKLRSQNPTFGFYFLKLATARLFDNVSRMESELARRQTAVAAATADP